MGEMTYLNTASSCFYWYGLTLISSWISNHMPVKVWDEITYPFQNFNGRPLNFGIG